MSGEGEIRPRHSLRQRLVIGIGVPLLVSFVVVIIVQFRIDRDLLVESVRQQMRADVQIECLKMEASFLAIEHAVATQHAILEAGASQFVPIGTDASETKLNVLLTTVLQLNPFAYGATFSFNPNQAGLGRAGFAPYVYRTQDRKGLRDINLALDAKYDYSHASWFVNAGDAPDGIWSEPYFDAGGGDESMTTYSLRFRAASGLPGGVATADVTLSKITDALVASSKASEYDFALISANGRCISVPTESAWMKGADDFAPESYDRQMLDAVARFKAGGPEFARIGSDSQWSFTGTRLVFVKIPSSAWVLVGSFAEVTLLPQVIHALFLGPGVLLAAAIVALAVVWISASRAVMPLQGVVVAIGRFAKGDLSARAPTTERQDEIGLMARAFNKMGDALQGAIAEREASEAKRLAIEAQIQAARDIQRLLLPAGDVDDQSADCRATDAFSGVSIVAFSSPSDEIAGDFFDWFERPDGSFALVIADVCGHGLPAAMMMAVCRTLVRRAACDAPEPHVALAQVNRDLIAQAPQTKFTTGILLYIDADAKSVRYANAGHPSAILARRDGTTQEVMASTGTVLGITTQSAWTTEQVEIASGDDLVLISDGVTEAGPPGAHADALFGSDRAAAAVRATCRGTRGDPRLILQGLRAAVREWSQGHQGDDLTIITLHRK